MLIKIARMVLGNVLNIKGASKIIVKKSVAYRVLQV